MSWHVLDTGSIWLKEFAAPLAEMVPARCWVPEISNFGLFSRWEEEVSLDSPPLSFTRFPLQRGYSRAPLSNSRFMGRRICNKLLRETPNAPQPTLVCTSPFYAPVVEAWPGRVIYYLTDFTPGYHGANAAWVRKLDRRVCKVAKLVAPNSRRIGDYLEREAGCDPAKILVVPNATRAQNILARPLLQPAALPAGLEHLPRPIVGVIGNLSSNMDWIFLREAIERSQDFSWVFVGPFDMPVPNARQSAARDHLISRGRRVFFTGAKPYGELYEYGRAFDVALMPYRRQEPTFSGSATRFYEHLAACRPILATRGVEELLHKEPLLRLVDSAEEAVSQLEQLRATGFQDGLEERRWRASERETWTARARTMVRAFTGEPHAGDLLGERASAGHSR